MERCHPALAELREQGRWLPEVGFEFPWYDGVTLSGRIDLLGLLPMDCVVIDYKPGQLTDKLLAQGLQMTIYQLAVERCLRIRHRERPADPKRGRFPTLPPLTSLRYFSYRSADWHDSPMRGPSDFAELRNILKALVAYFQTVLLAKVPAHNHIDRFRFFNFDDLLTGDITPRPGGDQCTFCAYSAECIATLRGQRPTARQAFLARYPKISRLVAGDPRADSKIRLALSELPYAELNNESSVEPGPPTQLDLAL